MEHKKTLRIWGGFLLLLLLTIVFLIWNLFAGSVRLSASEILEILRGGAEGSQRSILLQIRLPRLVAALILGGALSVSGYLLQTFFHNPIASPFVLGISSGAKLTIAVTMIALLSRGHTASSAALIAVAFLGAMVSMGFVLAVSQKVRHMSMLVVCGVMIGYICSAATDLLVTFADDSNIVNLHNWSMGSFSGMSWENVRTMALVCGAALVLSFFLSKPIRAYQLGEVYAQNMGVALKAFRTALILLSSILSACVTAFAGPISFVGIAVPHLMKSLFHSAEPLLLIPACFLGGGAFCLMCDLIARTAFAPHRGQHQLCYSNLRRARRHLYDGAQKGRLAWTPISKRSIWTPGTTEKPSCTTFVFACSAAELSRSSDPMAPANPPFSKRSSPSFPPSEEAFFSTGRTCASKAGQISPAAWQS